MILRHINLIVIEFYIVIYEQRPKQYWSYYDTLIHITYHTSIHQLYISRKIFFIMHCNIVVILIFY